MAGAHRYKEMQESHGRLLLYGGAEGESMLEALSALLRDWSEGGHEAYDLRRRALEVARSLLGFAEQFSFEGDIWACYLAFFLMTNENPFTRAAERRSAPEGTLRALALCDLREVHALLHYDFRSFEHALGIDCFSLLRAYQPPARAANAPVPEARLFLQVLARALLAAQDEETLYARLCTAHESQGLGQFALARAFRLRAAQGQSEGGAAPLPRERLALEGALFLETGLCLQAVQSASGEGLGALQGYERQKQQLRANTEAHLMGLPANNCLLYGDAGTGKSSAVRALLQEYGKKGLRIIELHKHQLAQIPALLAKIKDRNYRFLLFLDDLSFEEHEVSYKHLKALIEGGVEQRPENVLLYATSNRRHLIRETWKDREDMEFTGEIHRSETMQEKLSLASRFGLQINFDAPTPSEYDEIVLHLAQREGITLPPKQLLLEAKRWEIRHGGVSGRTARQFIDHLHSKER